MKDRELRARLWAIECKLESLCSGSKLIKHGSLWVKEDLFTLTGTAYAPLDFCNWKPPSMKFLSFDREIMDAVDSCLDRRKKCSHGRKGSKRWMIRSR